MDNITHRALCAFREVRYQDALMFLSSATAAAKLAKDDRYYILCDKAARAFEDCEAAHQALKSSYQNPVYAACDSMATLIRDSIGDKAEEAYARAEAEAECAAIADFHHNAYGEAA